MKRNASTLKNTCVLLPLLVGVVGCGEVGWVEKEVRYQAQIREHPDDPLNWVGLLEAQHELDMSREALSVAERAFDRFPDDPMVIGRVAQAYRRGGKLKQVESVLKKADLKDDDGITLIESFFMNAALARKEPARAAYMRLAERVDDRPDAKSLLDGLAACFDFSVSSNDHGSGCTITSCGQSEVHCSDVGGTIAVPVCIDEKGPFLLTLDSGGDRNITLRRSIAAQLGDIDTKRDSHITVLGKKVVHTGMVETVRIGEIVLKDVPLDITEDGDDSSVVGTIGTDIFRTHRITVDNRKKTFSVTPSSTRFGWPWRVRVLDFWRVSKKIIVSIEINGHGRGACVLDTGSMATIGSRRFATEHNTEEEPRREVIEFHAFGEKEEREAVLIPDVELELANAQVEFDSILSMDFVDEHLSSKLGIDIDLVIGNDVLGSFDKWIIDYPERKIAFFKPRPH